MTGIRIYKKIIDILADIIYIVILLYTFIAIPYLFGYTPMVVLSDTMDDAYSKGSIIYYSKTSQDNLKVGDVITFAYEGSSEVITHRITAINDDKYQTKADKIEVADPIPVKYSEIKGEVAKIYIPYAGAVLKYITSHIYLIVIACLILIAEFILNSLKIFNKDIKKIKKEENPEVEKFVTEVKKEQTLNENNRENEEESLEAVEVLEEEEKTTPSTSVNEIELPTLVNDRKDEN